MNALAIIPGFGQGVKGGQLLNRGRKLLNGTGKNTKKVVSSGKKVSASNKGPTHLHHSDPKFMGGNPKQPLTEVSVAGHKQLHKDLNDFLRSKTDDFGNHMRPQRGNSGARIRRNFTRQQRIEAMAEFYKKFRDEYPDSARDFFKQHPHLE